MEFFKKIKEKWKNLSELEQLKYQNYLIWTACLIMFAICFYMLLLASVKVADRFSQAVDQRQHEQLVNDCRQTCLEITNGDKGGKYDSCMDRCVEGDKKDVGK